MKIRLRNFAASGVAGVLAIGFQAAQAADLAVKAPVKAPPLHYSWTGCYGGGFVGWGGANDWRVTDLGGFNPAGANPFDFTVGNQATGGATLGCNLQVASILVLGLEGEGGYLDVAGNGQQPLAGAVFDAARIGSGYGLIAGRAGVALDRLLIYGKVGVAFYDTSATVTAGNLVATASKSQSPLALGLGGEYAIYDHWTGKAEYVFFDRGSSFDVCANPGTCWRQDPSPVHTFKVGLNYKW